MIGLGVAHTMQAIREVERDYFRYQVEGSGGGIKSIVTHDMRRSRYSINQVNPLQTEIKARANYANQDAAVILAKMATNTAWYVQAMIRSSMICVLAISVIKKTRISTRLQWHF